MTSFNDYGDHKIALANYYGLIIIRIDESGRLIQEKVKIDIFKNEIKDLVTDEENNVWACDEKGRVYKIN